MMSADSVVRSESRVSITQLQFGITPAAIHIMYCKLHQDGSVFTHLLDVSGWNLVRRLVSNEEYITAPYRHTFVAVKKL